MRVNPLKVCCLGGLQLQLQLVRDEGDELRVGGFAFGIADGIAEESLQSVQIASVPRDLNGVTDSTFDAAGSGPGQSEKAKA